MSRVRAFFAGKHEATPAVAAETAWSGGGGTLALVGTAVADEAPPRESVAAPPPEARRPPQPEPAPPPEPPRERNRQKAPASPRIDPLDPPWIERLVSLGAVGRELEGHRETTEALLRAVRQLPELTSDQTDHVVQTNRLLERQNVLLSSMLDTLAGVGASMQTMEESGRRHLTAIGQLEASHRQVLYAYQDVLERAHRRLGRLATLATVLAAVAVGGVAWVLYLALAAG
jgi:hypothetical protein